MLHQRITAPADPRIAAAVADFRAAVVEIRRLSADLFPLKENDHRRTALQDQIDDLVGGMQARADMIDVELDELFRLINDDLRRNPGPKDHRPHGEFERALVDENTAAYADEHTIHREISRLQALLLNAAERRLAADRACAGYVAGWAVRGMFAR